jgi:tRNA (guanosine-2'-O-)-methyltransferase
MEEKIKLLAYLTQFISENKIELFQRISAQRTRYITLVLEDIFQPHNASAVLRTADCYGIQDVHIIENYNHYRVNPDVALGAVNWINLNKYSKQEENTIETIKLLKSQGYRIIATSPHEHGVELENFDLEAGKIALLFGTERQGLSQKALDNADEFLKIPMYGFTESLNISVSAAIILHHLIWKLKQSSIKWQLSEEEIIDLEIKWRLHSIKKSKLILNRYYQQIQ